MIRNNIAFLSHVAHIELATMDDPEAHQYKRNYLAASKHVSRKRVVAHRAVGAIVSRAPELMRAAYDSPYTRRGYTVVGRGYNSTVVRDGESVVKIIRGSWDWTEAERDERVTRNQQEQLPVLDYLGRVALPQTIAVAPDLVHPAAPSVQLRQDFMPHFQGIDYAHLSQYPRTTRITFGYVARQALAMVEQTPFSLDLDGANNIGVAGDAVVLVDTIAVKADRPAGIGLTYRRLDALARSAANATVIS